MSTLTEKDDGLLAQLHNSRTNFEKIWGYRDLKAWVDGFYQDGKIEAKELADMKMPFPAICGGQTIDDAFI